REDELRGQVGRWAPHRTNRPQAGAQGRSQRRGTTMTDRADHKTCRSLAISVALLVSMISFVGCAGPGELLFKNSIVVDHLDGNYQILARCTYEHLARQQTQLSITDLREQETVRIALKAPQPYWELSFVNEDGGRQTRLEATSGSLPSEHT